MEKNQTQTQTPTTKIVVVPIARSLISFWGQNCEPLGMHWFDANNSDELHVMLTRGHALLLVGGAFTIRSDQFAGSLTVQRAS